MLTSETNKIIYTGDDASTVFPYTFKIFDDTEIEIVRYTIADGTEAILTSGYTVDGVGEDTGGNVTLDDPLLNEYKLVLRRKMPYTQETDWEQNSDMSTDVLENDLDRIWMAMQQLKEITDRMIVQDPTQTTPITLPLPVASKFIAWNAAGDGLENKELPDPSILVKASQSVAEAGIDDAAYMTALAVKQEVQKSGAVSIPAANIPAVTAMASQAEAVAGTENTKFMSALRTAQALAALGLLSFKAGTFTRDMTAGNGTVAYTGVGFTPRLIIFWGGVANSKIACFFGIMDGTNQYSLVSAAGDAADFTSPFPTRGIALYEIAGKTQDAQWVSFDADGFTLNWTKVGSPTAGSAGMFYVAIK